VTLNNPWPSFQGCDSSRYGHHCYKMQIENCTHAFEWCHFQWPWVSPNLDFKVMTFFNAKQLENGRPLLSRIWFIEWHHTERPWTTLTSDFKVTPLFDGTRYRIVCLSGLAKYSMTWSIVQSSCDSRATCFIHHAHNSLQTCRYMAKKCTESVLSFHHTRKTLKLVCVPHVAFNGTSSSQSVLYLKCHHNIFEVSSLWKIVVPVHHIG